MCAFSVCVLYPVYFTSKNMKMAEVQKKSKEELDQLLKEERDFLREFRFKIRQGKVKNNKLAREKKKNIARILTYLKALPQKSKQSDPAYDKP